MSKLTRWAGRIGVAAAATALAGCNLVGPPGGPPTTSPVTVRPIVPPTALLTVLSGPASGPALSRLVASTARPNEDIRILQAGHGASGVVGSGASGANRRVVVVIEEPTAGA